MTTQAFTCELVAAFPNAASIARRNTAIGIFWLIEVVVGSVAQAATMQ